MATAMQEQDHLITTANIVMRMIFSLVFFLHNKPRQIVLRKIGISMIYKSVVQQLEVAKFFHHLTSKITLE